jgi:hypothetical protein
MPARDSDGRAIDCGDPGEDLPCPPPAWHREVLTAAGLAMVRALRPGMLRPGPAAMKRLAVILGLIERDHLPRPRSVFCLDHTIIVEWGPADSAVGLGVGDEPGPLLTREATADVWKVRDELARIYPRRSEGGVF